MRADQRAHGSDRQLEDVDAGAALVVEAEEFLFVAAAAAAASSSASFTSSTFPSSSSSTRPRHGLLQPLHLPEHQRRRHRVDPRQGHAPLGVRSRTRDRFQVVVGEGVL